MSEILLKESLGWKILQYCNYILRLVLLDVSVLTLRFDVRAALTRI